MTKTFLYTTLSTLLKLHVPGGHDAELDDKPGVGPKGGKIVICNKDAWNPKNPYITKIVRAPNSGIRHGYRGFWETNKRMFRHHSILLPNDPVVKMVCEYISLSGLFYGGRISDGALEQARAGDYGPMLAEIKVLALKKVITGS